MPLSVEAHIIEQLFSIVNKQGEEVPFVLNSAQRALDEHRTGRDVVAKARQEGISSYVLARFTVACLAYRNTHAVVISHESEATQRMFQKVFFFLRTMRGPKPVLGRQSKRELYFPKTDSTFYIGTAGSRSFGRGDTISHLHCSEVAYWMNPEDLTAGLFQAVPTVGGEIFVESTGNGHGNWFHRLCQRAREGKSRYTCHFFPWHTFAEYQLPVNEPLGPLDQDLEEPQLVESHQLGPERLAWRRAKIEELDYDLVRFKREYPTTFDECFIYSGTGIFRRVKFVASPAWVRDPHDRYLTRLEGHPRADYTYSLGVDASAGVGNDNAVIQVSCLNTNEQVAEWASDNVDPTELGEYAARLGHLYNEGFLTVENNNHGLVTLQWLKDHYPNHLLYKNTSPALTLQDYGWRTNAATRPLMIGALRTALSGGYTIYSDLLKSELSTFVESKTEDGRLRMQAAAGAMDDRVMALACSIVGFSRAGLYAAPTVERQIITAQDPFLLDSMLAELEIRNRGGGFERLQWEKAKNMHLGFGILQ